MYQRHKLRFKYFVNNNILHILVQATTCIINVKKYCAVKIEMFPSQTILIYISLQIQTFRVMSRKSKIED